MDPVLISAIVGLGGLGILFGGSLAFAAKKFAVEVNPKIELINEALPGANCGGCGFPGCAAYADGIVTKNAAINKCAPGGAETQTKIAAIMGLAMSELSEPKVAVVQCGGGTEQAKTKFIYHGIPDCTAAELIGQGAKSCKYGCLGLGSCVRACPFDAMYMDNNGLPRVIEDKCTACGICVTTCPRGIMALIPRRQKIFVACVSQDRGKAVKDVCSVGCTGCTLCANPKVTPTGSIKMSGNLPTIISIDAEELDNAVQKCPANSFHVRGVTQAVAETVKE